MDNVTRLGPVFIRTPYNYDTNQASVQSGLLCTDPSRARQEFREDADINLMLEKYGATGVIALDQREPLSGSFEEVGDYRTLIEKVQAADAAFMALPAEVRRNFDNDPAKFCDYCTDPANIEALRKMNLANPEPSATFGFEEVVNALKSIQEGLTPKG